MQLLSVEDPRAPLERARKFELLAFARQKGQTDLTEDMPAIIIRKRLRERGLTNIQVIPKPLGAPATPYDTPQADVNAVNADEALEADYASGKFKPPPAAPAKAPDQMDMGELRKACKASGIKMARTDNLRTLREKLNGKNAA